jgi:hypothetical protein
MDKLIKVLLIDPFEKEVSEILIPNTLEGYYAALDCHMVEGFYPFSNSEQDSHMGLADEEGLISDGYKQYFAVKDSRYIIANKAVILKQTPKGDFTDATMSAEELKEKIIFINPENILEELNKRK